MFLWLHLFLPPFSLLNLEHLNIFERKIKFIWISLHQILALDCTRNSHTPTTHLSRCCEKESEILCEIIKVTRSHFRGGI